MLLLSVECVMSVVGGFIAGPLSCTKFLCLVVKILLWCR